METELKSLPPQEIEKYITYIAREREREGAGGGNVDLWDILNH
jgi:hypothetical protein